MTQFHVGQKVEACPANSDERIAGMILAVDDSPEDFGPWYKFVSEDGTKVGKFDAEHLRPLN